MAAENIIQPNIPNAITIVVMAAVGGVIVAAIKKALGAKGGPGVAAGAAFTG